MPLRMENRIPSARPPSKVSFMGLSLKAGKPANDCVDVEKAGVVSQPMSGVSFEATDPLSLLGYSEDLCGTALLAWARGMDANDPVGHFKKDFCFPSRSMSEQPVIYFVGNSLGLQPRSVRTRVEAELGRWAAKGVNGHFEGKTNWLNFDDNLLVQEQAKIVGALPSEVALMNSLTVNLHLLLVKFLGPCSINPANARRKLLIEHKCFPSDFYAISSELRMRGFDPTECLVVMEPRHGETCLRTEDITDRIHALGNELMGVVFSGIHYYTGQLFDMRTITAAAHDVGAFALFDLAHVVGNVDVYLHDWGVDGACWCTYKYMNSGPGGIGGFFIHERHFGRPGERTRCLSRQEQTSTGSFKPNHLIGWWSHNVATRFEMDLNYDPSFGASEYRISNVPILSGAALLGSLDVFQRTSMQELRAKSILLTEFMLKLLVRLNRDVSSELCENKEETSISKSCVYTNKHIYQIITPSSKGAQLSLLFYSDEFAQRVCEHLEKNGAMVDYRKPGLVRASPAPLYCSFEDVVEFVSLLRISITSINDSAMLDHACTSFVLDRTDTPSIPQLHESLLGYHVKSTDINDGSFHGGLVCVPNDPSMAVAPIHPSIKLDEPVTLLKVYATGGPQGKVVWDAMYNLGGSTELTKDMPAVGGTLPAWMKICTPKGEIQNYNIQIAAIGAKSGVFSTNIVFSANNATGVKLPNGVALPQPPGPSPMKPDPTPVVSISPQDFNPLQYLNYGSLF